MLIRESENMSAQQQEKGTGVPLDLIVEEDLGYDPLQLVFMGDDDACITQITSKSPDQSLLLSPLWGIDFSSDRYSPPPPNPASPSITCMISDYRLSPEMNTPLSPNSNHNSIHMDAVFVTKAKYNTVMEELSRMSYENKKLREMLRIMCKNYSALQNHLMVIMHNNFENELHNPRKRKPKDDNCDTDPSHKILATTNQVPQFVQQMVEPNKGERPLKKCGIAEISIRLEDLQQHFGQKCEEAAKSLGVSVSTVKSVSRQHGILCWPFDMKSKGVNVSVKGAEGAFDQTPDVGAASLNRCNQIPECNRIEPLCSNVRHPMQLATTTTIVQTSPPDETIMEDEMSMTVKATYVNDIIKFELLSSSTMGDLEEKVAKRLKLMVGSFYIKYVDEDSDLVLIAYDEDLRYCMSSSRSVVRRTIKMLVMPINS